MSSVDKEVPAAPSSSSTAEDNVDRAEVMKKAEDLMAQGKRNMVCGEVPKAVNLFEEAVKLLVKTYGEMSRDCADAYYHCGCSLLELCRMESSVLGSALDGVDVEEEKPEKESEQFETPPADDDAKTSGTEDDNEETADDETAEETAEDDAEEGEDGEAADDVSHFQLAWEYLDVAKVIYTKKEDKDDQLKAAECLLKLGELSMENEQHETAAADMESALQIQQKHLPSDDRIIAETHYQLGLAYGLGKEFEKAIKQYQSAIGVIEAKIVSLNKLIEEKEVDADNKENKESDELMSYKKEIKDLKELIPEMKNKVEDTRVEQRDMDKIKEAAKELLGLSGGASKGFGSPTKKNTTNGATVDENGEAKAASISHLVRKKRKPEEDEATPQDLKKSRQESNAPTTNGINGHAETNGHAEMNGHASEKPSAEPEAMST